MRWSLPRLLRAPFWGVRAPASLKPGRSAPGYQHNIAFLGRSRPSLIEAGTHLRCHACTPIFLGRSRPSLIEARFIIASMVDRFGAFLGRSRPSLIEAFSSHRARAEPPPAFLGRSRPSLIEASRAGAPLAGFGCPFWGVRAPASLKPSPCDPRSDDTRRLSGAFAPQPH